MLEAFLEILILFVSPLMGFGFGIMYAVSKKKERKFSLKISDHLSKVLFTIAIVAFIISLALLIYGIYCKKISYVISGAVMIFSSFFIMYGANVKVLETYKLRKSLANLK